MKVRGFAPLNVPEMTIYRGLKMRRTEVVFTLCCIAAQASCGSGPEAPSDHEGQTIRIPVEEYRDKVYAAWLGQIVGNIYGLSYEFQFIDEPGPDEFPYGFGVSLNRVEDANGAFSDDDTDIEYMYLLQMEQHGIEPSYAQLAEAWKYHVRDKVWIANRAALALMHAGYGPPITGSKDYNPHWFQIDPQLVNEIWAVTAPGMLDYATEKSAWAAKITNDDFGIEPTIHYAAMYAAAFFEDDINRLIDIGTAALPGDSRFGTVVEHMKQLHQQYPDDWQKARAEMARHYYGTFDYNELSWPPADAHLNGACAILALLYGDGDFQRTLDVASGMGFDADNQAATMSGLLGIILGTEGLPEELLYPLGKDKWQLPFNDLYKNVSRHDLPDASLLDMAQRTARLGEKIILANGGKFVSKNGVDYYEIDSSASFTAPIEIATAPTLLAEIGQPFVFRYSYIQRSESPHYEVVDGSLPPGIELNGDELHGTPLQVGRFTFRIQATTGITGQSQDYTVRVHGENLAKSATTIIHNGVIADLDIEVVRDGNNRSVTLYSHGSAAQPHIDYYGYAWPESQSISALVFNPGMPREFSGWFTSLQVEHMNSSGEWQAVEGLVIAPEMDFDNTQWLKGSYIDHTLSFTPLTTRAIRIIGQAGGIVPDALSGEELRYNTSISELAVYAD